jgi:S-DNA-T family DNA segregation ATPase FtsK/SpoIIIE
MLVLIFEGIFVMAAKKKQTRKRKVEPKAEEPSLFWAVAWAIVLVVAAILLFIGGFGAGGPLPQAMFDGLTSAFGNGAFIVATALLYLGILKIADEDKRLPKVKALATIAFVFLLSGFLHVVSAEKALDGTFTDGKGGSVGAAVGGVSLGMLDTVLSAAVLLILMAVSLCLATGTPLKVLLKPFKALFQKREGREEDTDLKELKERHGFKKVEGVPTVNHNEEKARPRLSSLRNSAEKLTPTENHAAHVTRSDSDWQFPGVNLLNQKQDKADAGDVEGNAQVIQETFEHFNIAVEMEGANIGPRVTQYTLKPPTGVKLTKITALENNLALDLAATSIRMEAPIPGKRAVGIEVPNVKPAIVRMASLLQSREWSDVKSPLGFVIGKDIAGNSVVGDLAKMPHLLVAGQTGSGKSVMINDILTSLLYRNSPSDLKLILVDPKQVELTPYNDIPHLLTPVINEPEKCISALKWAVAEMERRLKEMASVGRRNIVEYNNLKKEEGMPYIVIVIDELADLMMMAARDVESLVVRLAQKARAAGIHLVLATQRPSVDVITGLIKANVPARIAFTVASQVDSRTIIDQVGAEKLLGQGDMLLLTSDMPKPKRVQGAFIDDGETMKVTDFIRMQRPPQYDDEIISQPVQLNGKGGIVMEHGGMDADDDMFKDAVRAVIEARKASTSLLQRRLRIGYGRAARLIESMEEQGIVGAADGSRPREVLVSSLDEVFGGGGTADEVLDENFPDDNKSNRDSYLVQ